MALASSGALDSAPAVTTELSVCRGLDAPGARPLICSARGRSVFAVLGPPGFCLSRGETGSWAVSLAPCAPGPALFDSFSWPGTPHHGAADRAPPSCSQGRAVPSVQSHCPSPSELLPGQCMHAAAL